MAKAVSLCLGPSLAYEINRSDLGDFCTHIRGVYVFSIGLFHHEVGRGWRVAAAALALSAALPAAAAAGDAVRIVSVDDSYDPSRTQPIAGRSGQAINFAADILDAKGVAQQRDLSQFSWSANDRDGDLCNAALPDACATGTSFQVTSYGVTFLVPDGAWSQIAVTVRANDATEVDAQGNPLVDTIIIQNSAAMPEVPATPVSDPQQYPNPSFDEDQAVSGYGNWVTVDNDTYFVPNTYLVDNDPEWVPYRHGHWGWSDGDGWTWISYDPWGWVTDHYGTWRYHDTYGWVWHKFAERRYEAAVVTWLHSGASASAAPIAPAGRPALSTATGLATSLQWATDSQNILAILASPLSIAAR
jgi:hypothetical protein